MEAVAPLDNSQITKVLIVNIGPHYFGATIENVQDVIKRSPTTKVPLAPEDVVGVLNLRGHIVTEINVAGALGIEEDSGVAAGKGYSLVVSSGSEMYSLVFEGVQDVVDIPNHRIEKLPDTVNKEWIELSRGVYRMEDKLVVILDFEILIKHLTEEEENV